MNNVVQQRPDLSPDRAAKLGEVRTITSGQLLRGERIIVIVHHGKEYRLQVTANGKLILTK